MNTLCKRLNRKQGQELRSQNINHILNTAEPFEEIKKRTKYRWILYTNIPISWLSPSSPDVWATDPDLSEKEIDENESRFQEIVYLLQQGEELWPIIVDENCLVIDGYHRLVAAFYLEITRVNIVRAISK